MDVLTSIAKQLEDSEMAYREANRMVKAGKLSSSRYYRNIRDYWWGRYRKAKAQAPAIITTIQQVQHG